MRLIKQVKTNELLDKSKMTAHLVLSIFHNREVNRMRQNKYELRISILFIFKHCFMLPFSPYPILLITLNTMLVASSDRIFFFFAYHPSQDFFVCLGVGGGDFHPTSGYF